nr:zinc finger, CCHC-type [Tanacetum cinerariifolium]
MTTSVGNNSVFRSFFEKQKLTGPNFIDWYRQLRLVLSIEDKENYLEHPIPAAPVATPGQQVPPAALAAHAAWVKGQKEVAVLMLLTMDLEIQRNLAHLGAYDMLQELKAMYSKQAEHELLQTVREFHTCKQAKVSLILVSLNKDFDNFVQNYNMHGMGKTVNELHAMLKLHEETLPKKDANPALHAIRAGRVQKNQKNKSRKAGKGSHGKGKGKMGNASNNASFASKPKTPPPPKKDNPAKDAICHQCGEVGHWRRNCPVYLAELMKKKKLPQGDSTSGSTGNGLVIVLNNCHYAPSITRGVISVSRLFDDGFVNRFDHDNVISVSKNNLVYFKAIPRDGIYEINMSCSNTNDSSMYAITNKRAKIDLDSSLLWHCRLGHISKKRIEKLQHDGLLNSIDIESLGKCVSCMSEYINSVNASRKSKSVKKPVNWKVWKTTGKVFKTIGYIWKPTRRTFTLVGNVCPLTRIATATIVPPREPIPIVQSTDKPVVTLVYTRKPRAKNVPNKMKPNKSWGSSSNVSTSITDCRLSKSSFGICCSKYMTGDRSQLINFVQKFLGTVKFRNDHVAKIMGYGDYQIGNVMISRVYYVEGLRDNLFSIGQFCDSDLEVAFRQHTCFI